MDKIAKHYKQLAEYSIIAYCFFAPLSIAGSQCALGLFLLSILFGLLNAKKDRLHIYDTLRQHSQVLSLFYLPAIAWILLGFFTAPLGLDILSSLKDMAKLSLFCTLPLCIFVYLHLRKDNKPRQANTSKLLWILLLSQSLAALHSLIEIHVGSLIPPKIPGAVTESGQLVLIIALTLSLLALYFTQQDAKKTLSTVSCVFALLLSLGIAWNAYFLGEHTSSALVTATIVIILLATLFYSYFSLPNHREVILSSLLALFVAALLVNGKRGPLLAIMVELFVLGFFFSRKLTFFGVAALLLFSFAPPVYDRLGSLYEHFFIGGGRFDMWKLGFQLIEQYPLGIGFGNSDLMREFDPSLPELHRHMHNNILNVALENGILSALVFIWWFYHLFAGAVKSLTANTEDSLMRHLSIGITAGLIGWQVAGLVEYNFGDGEILFLVLFLIGVLLFSLSTLDKVNSKH